MSTNTSSIVNATRSRRSVPITRNKRHHAYRNIELESLESRILLSAVTPAVVVGPAAKLVIGVQPTNGYVGVPNAFSLTVEVEDAGGNLVNTDISQVKIKLVSGPAGGLGGTLKATAVAGIATFSNLLFSKTGTYTVRASDGALTATTSDPITINAAPKATTLVFAQAPVGNATGAAISTPITVNVIDQYGNPLTTSTSVTLKLFTGPAHSHISGKVTVKAIGGTATFSTIAVSKGGDYVLQAKDGPHTVNSAQFTMGGPPVATSLAFLQQPSDTVAGVNMTPGVTVEVEDQYGHVLTTNHSTIKLTVATGLDSTKVFTAPVKLGVATFSKLHYNLADSYTLRATDAGLTPDVSTSFNISAGAAAGLAFEQIPATHTLHSAATVVKVDVVDKFGNVATANTSTVMLSYANAPGGTAPLSLSVAAVAGVASFDALTFPAAGRFALKAVDSPLAPAVSTSFTLI